MNNSEELIKGFPENVQPFVKLFIEGLKQAWGEENVEEMAGNSLEMLKSGEYLNYSTEIFTD